MPAFVSRANRSAPIRFGRSRSIDAATSSWSRPINTVDRCETSTSVTSRPISLQCRAEHGDLAGDDLGLAEQVAAVGVARRQSQRAPLAGTTDDDRHMRLDAAAGSTTFRRSSPWSPRSVAIPCPTASAAPAVHPRDVRIARPTVGKSMPAASYSWANHPTPSPHIALPPDSTSSVAICLASTAGRWRNAGDTSTPRRTRSVTAANHDSAVYGSGMSAHAAPT